MQTERQGKNNTPRLSFHLMKFAVQEFQKNSDNLTADEYSQVFQHAKEEMLLHQIILASDEACCVVIPDSILKRTLQAIIAESSSDEAFHYMLAANNLQLSDYIRALHNDLRVETVLGRISSTVQSVTTSEMFRYYKSHRAHFRRPAQRQASLIQIFSQSKTAVDPSFTIICGIKERLCKHPENFAHEAETFSECDTKKDGGRLGVLTDGVLTDGDLCRELNTTLFSLKQGEISEVIEKGNAYHILKCNAIFPAINVPFKEATAKIFPKLLKEKKLSACRLWLQELIQGTKQA